MLVVNSNHLYEVACHCDCLTIVIVLQKKSQGFNHLRICSKVLLNAFYYQEKSSLPSNMWTLDWSFGTFGNQTHLSSYCKYNGEPSRWLDWSRMTSSLLLFLHAFFPKRNETSFIQYCHLVDNGSPFFQVTLKPISVRLKAISLRQEQSKLLRSYFILGHRFETWCFQRIYIKVQPSSCDLYAQNQLMCAMYWLTVHWLYMWEMKHELNK